jgi:pimeloyl-ACP methyl ester carboxylesterase
MSILSMRYKSVRVNGCNVFYREAGNAQKKPIILLNGFPNSSSVFQELMEDLKKDYYLVAPDFPGFGNSDQASEEQYEYSFDNISRTIEDFMTALGLSRPSVYALGDGGAISFRIAMRKPDAFAAFILQNTNAYVGGWGSAMAEAVPSLQEGSRKKMEWVKPLLSDDGMRLFYLSGARDRSRINPDHYTTAFHNRPGREQAQLELFADHSSNIHLYPCWQRWLQETQPKMLLIWGGNSVIFSTAAAEAFKNDVPGTKLYVYDTSQMALEEHHQDIAGNIRYFLG